MQLSPRKERFCRAYLKEPDAYLAARQAGYTGKNAADAAGRLVAQPEILQRLHELQAEQCAALGLDRSWVMLQAAEIYRRCMEKRAEKRWDTSAKAYVESGEYTFDGQGALRALRFIAELLGEAVSAEGAVAVTLIDDMEETKENG